MHPKNFGSEKIVRTYVEISHFKYPSVSAVNREATWTLRDKHYNNNNAGLLFRLNYSVYIDVDNRERAKARDKEQRRPISLEKKTCKFYSGGEKTRNASGHQGENERQWKKKMEQEQMRYLLHKTCNKEVSGSFTM